jgi:hypothetical protein
VIRTLVVLVSAAPVMAVAGIAAPAAAPAPTCVSAPDFTVYAPQPTTRTITVTTTACGFDLGNGYAGSDSVWVELGTPASGAVLLRGFTGSQDGVTFTKQVTMDRADPLGRWTVDNVIIHDANDVYHEFYGEGSFLVRGNTHLTLSASPATVRPGQLVTLTGALTRLTASGRYVGYADQPVHVDFRAAFTRAWQDRAELRGGTSSGGTFAKTVATLRSGSLQACFPGTLWYGPSCATADVTVDLSGS